MQNECVRSPVPPPLVDERQTSQHGTAIVAEPTQPMQKCSPAHSHHKTAPPTHPKKVAQTFSSRQRAWWPMLTCVGRVVGVLLLCDRHSGSFVVMGAIHVLGSNQKPEMMEPSKVDGV